MNINELQIHTPYEVTQSKYQFKVGDKVYLYNNNIIALYEEDSFIEEITLVGGAKGFAITGRDTGFLELNEIVSTNDFKDKKLPANTNMTMRDFLRDYDKTEFISLEGYSFAGIGNNATLLKR